MIKKFWLIILILLIGTIFRFYITWGGNFLFNMDNARDMVDVREMLVLKKWRLIGPTSAIDGVYNGPAWYYLLAIPFTVSGGNPYSEILMEIILWIVGGAFLLYLVQKYFGILETLIVGSLWVASNYIILGTQYSFNPNPTIFLAPVFVYLLDRYLEGNERWVCVFLFILVGLFIQFEIMVGIILPLVILLAVVLSGHFNYLKSKNFWLGILTLGLTFLPQLFFDLRHSFLMTKALVPYFQPGRGANINLIPRVENLFKVFYQLVFPTFLNSLILVYGFLVCLVLAWPKIIREKLIVKDSLFLISWLLVLCPLIVFLVFPLEVMRWHFNESVAGLLIVLAFLINQLKKSHFAPQVFSYLFLSLIVVFSLVNILEYLADSNSQNPEATLLKNQEKVLDYVYQDTKGKNFRAYTYLPSVIDYQYQYLFWWYGQKKYGYLPKDYAYLPNEPEYIKYKPLLNNGNSPRDSLYTYLIIQPDTINKLGEWKDHFQNLKLIETEKIGSITVEKRSQVSLMKTPK